MFQHQPDLYGSSEMFSLVNIIPYLTKPKNKSDLPKLFRHRNINLMKTFISNWQVKRALKKRDKNLHIFVFYFLIYINNLSECGQHTLIWHLPKINSHMQKTFGHIVIMSHFSFCHNVFCLDVFKVVCYCGKELSLSPDFFITLPNWRYGKPQPQPLQAQC